MCFWHPFLWKLRETSARFSLVRVAFVSGLCDCKSGIWFSAVMINDIIHYFRIYKYSILDLGVEFGYAVLRLCWPVPHIQSSIRLQKTLVSMFNRRASGRFQISLTLWQIYGRRTIKCLKTVGLIRIPEWHHLRRNLFRILHLDCLYSSGSWYYKQFQHWTILQLFILNKHASSLYMKICSFFLPSLNYELNNLADVSEFSQFFPICFLSHSKW